MDQRLEARIPDKMYFSIGDVTKIVGVKAHVLRYWETRFSLVSPEKSPSSQRRLYRKTDVEGMLLIKHLLYDRKFSIEGAKKHIQGLRKDGQLGQARRTRAELNEDGLQALAEARGELLALIELCR